MTKNPILNALAGLGYISIIASLLFYSSTFEIKEPSVFIPIGILSLFVFSAATMGYIFMYQPLQMFLEGEKKQAVDLFLKTLASFAVLVALFVLPGLYFTSQM